MYDASAQLSWHKQFCTDFVVSYGVGFVVKYRFLHFLPRVSTPCGVRVAVAWTLNCVFL